MTDFNAATFGVCCACMEKPAHHIVLLPFELPAPALTLTPTCISWGCVVCGLPAKGAVAVLCGACSEEFASAQTPLGKIRMVVAGETLHGLRLGVRNLAGVFGHDSAKHDAEEQDLRWARFGDDGLLLELISDILGHLGQAEPAGYTQ